ncbi:DoxX family protein [Longitalea arenae]|uniref:DoxX family protein n=1 Tax=Longitalea arenae TaxID=2812558 RepID=UPI001F0855DA|nr:DoxX family protein [Longitalea arenae]
MKRMIFYTDRSIAPFLLRLFLALVLFPHGAQKLLGWFNGQGFAASMAYFTDTVHLPWLIGFIVIIIEFFGPLFLLFGFAVRLWSIAIAIVMAGIILTHFTDYFFMNWFGHQKTEGMEFFLLVIGMTGALIYSGAGRYSIDAGYLKRPLA